MHLFDDSVVLLSGIVLKQLHARLQIQLIEIIDHQMGMVHFITIVGGGQTNYFATSFQAGSNSCQ